MPEPSLYVLSPVGQDRAEQVRTGQVRVGQVRADQVRAAQVHVGQVRVGQVRAGQVREGLEVRPRIRVVGGRRGLDGVNDGGGG